MAEIMVTPSKQMPSNATHIHDPYASQLCHPNRTKPSQTNPHNTNPPTTPI
jgi:hypothetical protein